MIQKESIPALDYGQVLSFDGEGRLYQAGDVEESRSYWSGGEESCDLIF